jgi:DNA polymerase III alpha subunit
MTHTWETLTKIARDTVQKRGLGQDYVSRLDFELAEVEKQGGGAYWLNLWNDGKKFDSNPNHLILPWLLGMMVNGGDIDPIAARKHPMLNSVRMSKVVEYQKEHGNVPDDFLKDPDMPDIDLDCLPTARDPIKQYAMEKYGQGLNDDGYGPVCSVGTWQTYKFRSAIIDVCQATGFVDKSDAYNLTTTLPDEVDDLKEGGKSKCKGFVIEGEERKECGTVHGLSKCPNCGSEATEGPTIGKLLEEHEQLKNFTKAHKKVILYAIRIIGRIRNMGMHAGALIIADRSLYGSIPMAKSKSGYWVSMWSEGRNTQLSKFGYIKWDILGLKTLEYIFECCKLIEQNRGISFGKPTKALITDDEAPPSMSGWEDIDPTQNRAGHFFDRDGNKHYIDLNDKHALKFANELKTDAVFQFDTELAKSILSNGVRNFEDLMLFNAMGHPGPMASIPEAVANREDSHRSWANRLPAEILEVLKDTYGVIVYQEQLQAIWQRVAGFTAPEAQEARKAVAKKWVHKLKPIRDKWIEGASRALGKSEAVDWWSKMETFGRYAFNRSHAVSYCLVAHRCLWLKAHFAPEWWASVMSGCHPDKLVRYMGVARSEGWEPTEVTRLGRPNCDGVKGVSFDTINLKNLTRSFTATNNVVNQGLIGIKGIGENAAIQFEGRGEFTDIDDFIEQKGGKKKTVLERFVKLGAFKAIPGHENTKALWTYYRYKYCTGKDITILKREIRGRLLEKEGWDQEAIEAERARQTAEYKTTYPNRRKIPAKFGNWEPKPDDSLSAIVNLLDEEGDFGLDEILGFEKEYLGYYLHSPLDLFDIQGECTIEDAKEIARHGGEPRLEAVITDIQFAETKSGNDYGRLYVSDGIQTTLVFIWQNELRGQDANNLVPGTGVQMNVDYDESRNTFTLARGEIILKLYPKNWRTSGKTNAVPISVDA